MLYSTIVADPPWPYDNTAGFRAAPAHRPNSWDTSDNSAERRYGSLSIAALCDLPVAVASAADAHLYLWTTNSFLVEAHEVARAWGFEPKTMITWGKVKKGRKEFEPSMKTGYWYRSATEHVLFAVRGKLRLQVAEGIPTLFLHERLQHSVKPDAFQDLVEKVSPGPFLEMFARRVRPGWSVFGNQVPGSVALLGGGDK